MSKLDAGAKNGTILMVEDDESIIDCMGEILQISGYRSLIARDGKEALEHYEKSGETIDLIITDINLPDIIGTELFKKIRANVPQQRFILTSGCIEDEHRSFGDDHCRLLAKPYNISSFISIVEEMVTTNLS